ncbi:MAG TPA: hypothetical protein V6D22_23195, partial [Candidatus Obscuribacterales bacterium]
MRSIGCRLQAIVCTVSLLFSVLSGTAVAAHVATTSSVKTTVLPSSGPVALNLGSPSANIMAPVGIGSKPVTIRVGSHAERVSAGTLLTPAELVVVEQILQGGIQTLVLSANGVAKRGAVFIGSGLNESISSVTVPRNVTVVDRIGSLSLTGDLIDLGTLYLTNSAQGSSSASVSANNISIVHQGLISTLLPLGTIQGQHDLGLALSATGNISNAGTISSAGALSLTAGGSLTNSLPRGTRGSQPTIQAANEISLVVGSGGLVNSGLIAVHSGDLNVSVMSPGTNLAVNGAHGTFQAPAGAINFRLPSVTSKSNVELDGGDYLSNQLNLYAGQGTVNVNAGQISGTVNIDAGAAHVVAATSDLKLGSINLSGDPSFYNTAGAITLGLPLTIQGAGSGADLAVIAATDITATGTGNIDVSSSSQNGGNILFIAGAQFSSSPSISGQQNNDFSGSTLSIVGASSTGGKIDLTGATINNITSSSTASGAGNITMVALEGTGTPDAGAGTITLSPSTSIIATGKSGGFSVFHNGEVTLIAGASSGTPITAITTGPITTYAANGASSEGDITIATAVPTMQPFTLANNSSGSVTGTATPPIFVGAIQPNASISTGSLIAGVTSVGGGAINVLAGNNVHITGPVAAGTINIASNSSSPLTTSSSGPVVNGVVGSISCVASSLTLDGGAITLSNAGGDINLGESMNNPGTNIVLVASGNINTVGSSAIAINTAAPTYIGGTVIMVAGAQLKQSLNAVQIVGAGAGGNIDLAAAPGISSFNCSNDDSASNLGNIVLVAFGGAGIGKINIPSGVTVTTSGSQTGTNGSVTMIAGDTTPGDTDIGGGFGITTSGGSGTGGNIILAAATPVLGIGSIVAAQDPPSFSVTAGHANGAIVTGALNAGISGIAAGNVEVLAGTDVQIAGAVTGNNITISSNSSTPFSFGGTGPVANGVTGTVTALSSAGGDGGSITIANAGGDISLASSLTKPGTNLTFIASANIDTAGSSGIPINTSSVNTNGGNVTIISGAQLVPSLSSIQITGAGASGNIDLASAPGMTSLNTSSSATNGNGGNVTLIAFGGASIGQISLPSSTTITSGGAGTGTNGNVTMIAGDTTAADTVIGGGFSVNTTGGSGGGGNVTIASATPDMICTGCLPSSASVTLTNGSTSLVTGIFGGGTLQAAAISLSNLSTSNSLAQIYSMGNIVFAPGSIISGCTGCTIAGGDPGSTVTNAPAGLSNQTNTDITVPYSLAAANVPNLEIQTLAHGNITIGDNLSNASSEMIVADGSGSVSTPSGVTISSPSISLSSGSGDINVNVTGVSAVNVATMGNATIGADSNISLGAAYVTGTYLVQSAGNITTTAPITGGRIELQSSSTTGAITIGGNITAGSIALTTPDSGAISAPNHLAGSIPLGGTFGLGTQFVLNAAGTRGYAYFGGQLVTIDTSNNSVIAAVPVNVGPNVMAVDPSGAFVYLAGGQLGQPGVVSIVSTSSNSVVATIQVGNDPRGIAVNLSGTRLYVTNWSGGTVSVIQLSTDKVVATIPVGLGPEAIAVNPSGTQVYVGNQSGNSVSVIQTSTNTVVATIPGLSTPLAMAMGQSGRYLYVGNDGNFVHTVSVIDTSTNKIVGNVSLPQGAVGVDVDPSGTFVYALGASGSLFQISTLTNTLVATANGVGTPRQPAGNFLGAVGNNVTAYIAYALSTGVSIIQSPALISPTISLTSGSGAVNVAGSPTLTASTTGNVTITGVGDVSIASSSAGSTFIVGATGSIIGAGTGSAITAPQVALSSVGGNIGGNASATTPLVVNSGGTSGLKLFAQALESNGGGGSINVSDPNSEVLTISDASSASHALTLSSGLSLTIAGTVVAGDNIALSGASVTAQITSVFPADLDLSATTPSLTIPATGGTVVTVNSGGSISSTGGGISINGSAQGSTSLGTGSYGPGNYSVTIAGGPTGSLTITSSTLVTPAEWVAAIQVQDNSDQTLTVGSDNAASGGNFAITSSNLPAGGFSNIIVPNNPAPVTAYVSVASLPTNNLTNNGVIQAAGGQTNIVVTSSGSGSGNLEIAGTGSFVTSSGTLTFQTAMGASNTLTISDGTNISITGTLTMVAPNIVVGASGNASASFTTDGGSITIQPSTLGTGAISFAPGGSSAKLNLNGAPVSIASTAGTSLEAGFNVAAGTSLSITDTGTGSISTASGAGLSAPIISLSAAGGNVGTAAAPIFLSTPGSTSLTASATANGASISVNANNGAQTIIASSIVADGTVTLAANSNSASQISVPNGGTITSNTATITLDSYNVSNNGTLTAAAGTGDRIVLTNTGGSALTLSGVGMLNGSSAGTDTAVVNVQLTLAPGMNQTIVSGNNLMLSNVSMITSDGSATFTGTGNYSVSGGAVTFTGAGTVSFGGPLNLNATTLTIQGAAPSSSGKVNVTAGMLSLSLPAAGDAITSSVEIDLAGQTGGADIVDNADSGLNAPSVAVLAQELSMLKISTAGSTTLAVSVSTVGSPTSIVGTGGALAVGTVNGITGISIGGGVLIDLSASHGSLAVNSCINCTLSSPSVGLMAGSITVNAPITSGNVNLTADTITSNGALITGSSSVSIAPLTVGRDIAFNGSVAGQLSLDSTLLSNIQTRLLLCSGIEANGQVAIPGNITIEAPFDAGAGSNQNGFSVPGAYSIVFATDAAFFQNGQTLMLGPNGISIEGVRTGNCSSASLATVVGLAGSTGNGFSVQANGITLNGSITGVDLLTLSAGSGQFTINNTVNLETNAGGTYNSVTMWSTNTSMMVAGSAAPTFSVSTGAFSLGGGGFTSGINLSTVGASGGSVSITAHDITVSGSITTSGSPGATAGSVSLLSTGTNGSINIDGSISAGSGATGNNVTISEMENSSGSTLSIGIGPMNGIAGTVTGGIISISNNGTTGIIVAQNIVGSQITLQAGSGIIGGSGRLVAPDISLSATTNGWIGNQAQSPLFIQSSLSTPGTVNLTVTTGGTVDIEDELPNDAVQINNNLAPSTGGQSFTLTAAGNILSSQPTALAISSQEIFLTANGGNIGGNSAATVPLLVSSGGAGGLTLFVDATHTSGQGGTVNVCDTVSELVTVSGGTFASNALTLGSGSTFLVAGPVSAGSDINFNGTASTSITSVFPTDLDLSATTAALFIPGTTGSLLTILSGASVSTSTGTIFTNGQSQPGSNLGPGSYGTPNYSVSITVGSSGTLTITPTTPVTPAEWIAAIQVQNTATQTLNIGSDNAASGGSFTITSANVPAGGFTNVVITNNSSAVTANIAVPILQTGRLINDGIVQPSGAQTSITISSVGATTGNLQVGGTGNFITGAGSVTLQTASGAANNLTINAGTNLSFTGTLTLISPNVIVGSVAAATATLSTSGGAITIQPSTNATGSLTFAAGGSSAALNLNGGQVTTFSTAGTAIES